MTSAVLQHERVDLLSGSAADAVALIDAAAGPVTYGELRARVAARAGGLGLEPRSLVLLEAGRTVEFVISYLAVLAAGHVPLLAGSQLDRVTNTWDVDAVIRSAGSGFAIERRGRGPHALHPDLALLLGTSGSTGAPKLVRLSSRNIVSNAAAIGEYLGLDERDCGITSLPLHYCYGLSVLHSHLLAGASLVLTEASVVDPCFAAAMRDHHVTNVAGVPHTFELLDRVGPDAVHTESLRFLTQAGGRMIPERVVSWADRAERWGVDFYVMYGQTEATARMAYLPPHLVRRQPHTIGVAIPGGEIEIRPVDGLPAGVGELVYRGPNVMLGYATTMEDLAAGPTIDELNTGDLGRYHAGDGVFEIVGRASRFVKPFGLRIDLDAVEHELGRAGVVAAVTGDDQRLVVCTPDADATAVRERVSSFTGLPNAAVVVAPTSIPRTQSGKIDYDAVARSAAGREDATASADASTVADVFGACLDRRDVDPSSTFVSLGGDSLNYVECSIQLQRVLGPLPSDWHVRPVAELEAAPNRRTPTRSIRRIDTTVLLRALAICAIVSTHMRFVWFPGGSHVLLVVAGYNLARFQLPIVRARDRLRAGLRTAVRVATPAVVWTAAAMVLVGGYSWATLALINNNIAPRTHDNGRWHYWFTETFVQLTLAATLLLAIPAVRRYERKLQYLFPLALFATLLVFRYRYIELGSEINLRFRTQGVAWFFVLGWLAHQSSTPLRRIITCVLCWYTIDGFFAGTDRESVVAIAVIVLVWVRTVPLPQRAVGLVSTIASASMWIYISHFRIYPPLDRGLPRLLALIGTIGIGIAIWRASEHVGRVVSEGWRGWRTRERPRAFRQQLAVSLD